MWNYVLYDKLKIWQVLQKHIWVLMVRSCPFNERRRRAVSLKCNRNKRENSVSCYLMDKWKYGNSSNVTLCMNQSGLEVSLHHYLAAWSAWIHDPDSQCYLLYFYCVSILEGVCCFRSLQSSSYITSTECTDNIQQFQLLDHIPVSTLMKVTQ